MSDEVSVCAGTLAVGSGESEELIEPKLIGGLELSDTGPPFGMYPLAPEALITTDGFLPCSAPAAVPFCAAVPTCALPCAI